MPPENIIYGPEIFVSSMPRWEWLFQGYISPSLIQLVRACSHLHAFFATGLFDWKEVVSWTPYFFLEKPMCFMCHSDLLRTVRLYFLFSSSSLKRTRRT